MAEKKQIAFAVSVAVVGLAGIYSFVSDFVGSFKENKPSLVDLGGLKENKEIFDSAKEELDKEGIFSGLKDHDENDLTNVLNKDFDTVGSVIRVDDGDTLCVDIEDITGDELTGTKIHIIGVDIPEGYIVSGDTQDDESRSVKDIVKNRVKAGDMVYIEYDEQKKDKNDNTLAYVYLSDGTMLEEWLLSSGYANAVAEPPNIKYADRFQELAYKAYEDKAGLWSVSDKK